MGQPNRGKRGEYGGPALPPGVDNAKIMSLVASGMTDKGVAATLGVSVNTVRRRVQGFMTATGSATRFEAGTKYTTAEIFGTLPDYLVHKR